MKTFLHNNIINQCDLCKNKGKVYVVNFLVRNPKYDIVKSKPLYLEKELCWSCVKTIQKIKVPKQFK